MIFRQFLVPLSLFLVIKFVQAYVLESQKNIFYSNPSGEITFQAYNNVLPSTQGCSCNEFLLKNCTWTAKQVTSSKYLITWKLIHPSTGYGYCTLKDGSSTSIMDLAIIDDLLVDYSATKLSASRVAIRFKTKPSLSDSQLDSFFRISSGCSLLVFKPVNAKISNCLWSKYYTSTGLTSGNRYFLSISDGNLDILKGYASNTTSQGHKNVDFQIGVVPSNSKYNFPIYYSVSTPLTFYDTVNFVDIQPKTVVAGEMVKFKITGTKFPTGSTFYTKISLDGTNYISHGLVKTNQEMEFDFKVPSTVSGSLSKNLVIYFSVSSYHTLPMSISIQGLSNNYQISYESPGGCSITGNDYFNVTFTTIVGSQRNNFNGTIFNDFMSKEVHCFDWTDTTVTTVTCKCPSIIDVDIQLPYKFKFHFSINSEKESRNYATDKELIYKKPTFDFSPIGKIDTEVPKSIIIQNISFYDPINYKYNWFLRNKKTIKQVEITCTKDDSIQGFRCNNMSFLTSENKNYLSGTENLVNSDKITIESLCGCVFENTICSNGTLVDNSKCCSKNSTFCYIPCLDHCELFLVTKFGYMSADSSTYVSRESEYPFYFYPPPRINSFTPNSVVLNSSLEFTLTGGPFTEKGIDVEFRLLTNDSYSIAEMKSNNVVHPLNLTFINRTTFTFSNPPIGFDSAYEIYFTNNDGISWSTVSNIHFRSYDDKNRFSFEKIIGDQGLFKSTPGGSKMELYGNGFFPSTRVQVRYRVDKYSFDSNCEFFSSTTINCTTFDVFSSGISLPKEFQVDFSMNGVHFVPTGLNITFSKSSIPIIVQVIPSLGPLQKEPYSVDVKGITTSVDQCVWSTPSLSREYYSIPPIKDDEEITCPVPTTEIFKLDSTTFGRWTLSIKNSVTGQQSPVFFFNFYQIPKITGMSPEMGDAYGNFPIYLTGTGFDLPHLGLNIQELQMSFKLGDVFSSNLCIIHGGTNATCTVPSHPQKTIRISTSFNGKQYNEWAEKSYTSLPCPAGNYELNFELPCKKCPSGTYKPLAGFFECIKCEEGYYQPLEAQTSCKLCPSRTTTTPGAVNITDCDCKIGSWKEQNETTGTQCQDCPPGGFCGGRGLYPRPSAGYYWIRNYPGDQFHFVECKTASFCTGNVTNGQEGCIVGRTGLLCEDCASGYYRSSGKCELCNTDVQWRMIVVAIGLVILILLFFKFAQLKVSHLSSFSIAVSYFQIIAIFSAYNFKWPDSLKTALGYFKFLNLDLDIFVPECISIVTYAMKWGATVSVPLFFGVLLFVGFIFECIRSLLTRIWGKYLKKLLNRYLKVNRQNWITKQYSLFVISTINIFAASKTLKQLKEFGDKCIHTFVIICSFSYVFVVVKAAQIFNCTEIQGVFRMDSERSTICFQGDWWIYFPFALVILIGFGLGTIFLFGYVVLFKRKSTNDKTFHARFRFLFVRFREEKLFWEIIIIVRKLLISAVVIFLAGFPMLVILFSLLIMFIAFLLQVHNSPFRSAFHNIMEYMILLSTLLLLFCSLLFYIDDFPSTWNKDFFGVLCIVVVVFSTIFIGITIVFDFAIQWWTEKKKEKRLRKIQEYTLNSDLETGEKRIYQKTQIFDENGREIYNSDTNKIEKGERKSQNIEMIEQRLSQENVSEEKTKDIGSQVNLMGGLEFDENDVNQGVAEIEE
eukprot:gene1364-11986_t